MTLMELMDKLAVIYQNHGDVEINYTHKEMELNYDEETQTLYIS